ncbi:unnamed protein product [Bursaphelenchus xylophilus]|uniref:(pine wood nematode) hypothetical protein n=1 Tax=Bursaphelenchus xylophilus TaxID=6326 RepID=A0A1I7SFC6_BURXY|nr:unnamed protein product [Bursaphelenchus xylophilus]CAG9089677.1 unnamed protein product [Bursaphelenchus xylophilus]
MGGVFSKKEKSNVSDIQRNILQLKLGRDQCKRRIKAFNNQLDQHKEMAKELLKNGRKDRALLMLKRKRFVETQMARVEAQLDKLEQVIADVEHAQMNNMILASLEKGRDALTEINKAYPIELAQKILEDSEEAAEYQQEITEMLSGQLNEIDLEDVEKEFDELIHVELPDVPETEFEEAKEKAGIKKKTAEKRERVALEAS